MRLMKKISSAIDQILLPSRIRLSLDHDADVLASSFVDSAMHAVSLIQIHHSPQTLVPQVDFLNHMSVDGNWSPCFEGGNGRPRDIEGTLLTFRYAL